MAQNISYKSTFRGAVFFFPLANIPRICSNCALVMSLGYFFLIFLLYRFSLTLNRFLELKRLSRYKLWCKLGKPYHFPTEMIPSKYAVQEKSLFTLRARMFWKIFFLFVKKTIFSKKIFLIARYTSLSKARFDNGQIVF